MTARAARLTWCRVQVEMRMPLTYALRIWTGVFLLIGLAEAVGATRFRGAPGLELFTTIYYVDALAVAAIGALVFATTITEEREQQTLGLLRIAGFGPLAVLVGKSTASFLVLLSLLFVQVPFVLLSVSLGGVSTAHVLAGFEVLAAYAVLAAGAGLCMSALLARSRNAVLATVVVLAGLGILGEALPTVPAGASTSVLTQQIAELAGWLGRISVWSAFEDLGSIGGRTTEVVVGNVVLGIVLLALAGVRSGWQREGGIEAGGLRARASEDRRPRRLIRGAPIVWKDAVFFAGGSRGLLVRLLVYPVLIAAVVAVAERPGGGPAGIGEAATTAALWIGGIDLGIHAARVFRDEVAQRTLPLLLVLPGFPAIRVVEQKVASAAPVALPTFVYATAGFVVATTFSGDPRFSNAVTLLPVALVVALLCMLSVFLLVARLSLGFGGYRFKRPLASITFWALALFLLAPVWGAALGCCFFGWPLLVFLAPFVLPGMISARLRTLGGEL